MEEKYVKLEQSIDSSRLFPGKLELKLDLTGRLHALLSMTPVDRVNMIYMGLLGVMILVFRENLPGWELLFMLHMAGMAGVFFLEHAASKRPDNRFLQFVHTWYSLPLFLILFEEVHRTVHLIYPGWFDSIILHVEYSLFGVHPTVWFETFATPALTEYMNFAYFSYFLLIPAGGLALVLTGQRDLVGKLLFACALGYYVCYMIFHFFPIEGPYHTVGHLQQVVLTGGPFTFLVNWLEGFGRIHGGAFPSAHVTGATVVLIFMWVYARKTVWIFGPVIVSLYVSTVYLRYHYASDVPTGIIVGFMAAVLVLGLDRRKTKIAVHSSVKKAGVACMAIASFTLIPTAVECMPLSKLQDPQVKEIMYLILDFRFEEAQPQIEKLMDEEPGEPLPVLLKSEILWWKHINDRDSEHVRSDLLKTSQTCITLAESRLENDGEDLLGLFIAGSGHARVAAVKGMEEKKWDAVQEAMKARKLFRKLNRLAPDFCDAYTPLGIYEYYAAQQGMAARVLGGMMYGLFGDREKGIEYLQKSMECGDYSAPEAGFYLSLFYVHWEENVSAARRILDDLTDRYPGNLCFKGIHAYALGLGGEYHAAISKYREILEVAENRELYGPEGYATTRFFLADFLIRAEQYEDAAVELDWIINVELENAYWLTAHAHLARGRVSMKLGDMKRAQQELYTVLDLKDCEDSHRKAREYLDELQKNPEFKRSSSTR